MKKRKILSLFLSLCLLIGLLPTVALAADQEENAAGVRITEENYDSATSILTVHVQIKMPDNSGINTVGSLISYDSSKLKLVGKDDEDNDLEYTPTSTPTGLTDSYPIIVKLNVNSKTEYNVIEATLYGVGSRAGLFVGMGVPPGKKPNASQQTTDWLTIYQLRFKVSGNPTAVLNSDSLRIADPAKDNDVIKGAYTANDEYVVSVNSYDNKWFKYGKMKENTKPDLTGEHWAIPAANVTATYPGSANSPSATTYTVTVQNDGNGTASASPATAAAGTEITLSATANSGYHFKEWQVVSGTVSIAGNKFTMPSSDVTVKAIFEADAPTTYTVTFEANGGTASETSKQTGADGKLASLPTASRSRYSFDGWYTAASGGTQITTAYVFSANTTVYAHWTYTGGGGGGGSYTPSYSITVDKTENGTITVSPKSASKGDTVTITVKPDKGYELEMLKALDKDGDALKLTEKNGKYTFKMPSGKVTVKGSFVEETPVQIFKDVPVDAYYYEAVKWAAEKGITGGVGNGLFAPNQPCTRAQIVTFLWRAAGSPAPKNPSTSFGDVKPGSFYEQAVAWAVENGITGGTGDGKFSPDATCTRAQAVTFLYRAAGSPKVSGSAEFGDVATNAYYADAVAWAAKNGITGGIGGGLFGSGNDCTRAQIVTFLYRSVK